jgi:histone deacetylase 6
MRVTPGGYAQMTRRLLELARGRVVVALEGGYNLDVIGRSAAACMRVLHGEEPAAERLPDPHALARRVIDESRRILAPYWGGL